MPSLLLPISLDSAKNFQAFFNALGDRSIEKKLLESPDLDPSVRQVIKLLNDELLRTKSNELIGLMKNSTKNREVGLNDFRSEIDFLKERIDQNYPEGFKLLVEYASMMQSTPVSTEPSGITTALHVAHKSHIHGTGQPADQNLDATNVENIVALADVLGLNP